MLPINWERSKPLDDNQQEGEGTRWKHGAALLDCSGPTLDSKGAVESLFVE